MLRFCVLWGALVSLASLALGQEAYVIRRASGMALWAAGKTVPDLNASDISRISWSRDGKLLAIQMNDGGLRLFNPQTGLVSEIAKQAKRPKWSPSAQKLIYEAEGGLWVFDADTSDQSPVKVIIEGQSPTWSPDGVRIAFSAKGAIWIALANGTAARRVAINRSAVAMDWSSDGRQLGFQEKGLSSKPGLIFVVGVNRNGLRRVGEGKAERVEFSPDGRRLLIDEKPRSRILDIEKSASTFLAPEGKDWTWVGSKKLNGLLGISPVQAELPDGTMQPLAKADGLPEGEIQKWAEAPNLLISNDLLSKGPFANMAKPIPDTVRLHGFVESVDPLNGKFTLSVTTVIDNKGWETNLAQSATQKLNVPDSARENDGAGRYKPLRVMNIRPDLEVSVIVRGASLDTGKELEVTEVCIAADSFSGVNYLGKEGPRLRGLPIASDGVSPEKPVVPLVYPVAGKDYLQDWFLASRGGGTRRHIGQDLMAPKTTPLVACFDGTIYLGRGGRKGHYTMTIRGDNGWTANYYHVNNDTPGTDDGNGGDQYAFAPGLESGQRVTAGQFIGYVGDSGNAESTPPHLHFELWDQVTGGVINAYPSLMAAKKIGEPIAEIANPEMKPRKGEQRMDGIVRLVDKDRKVVQIDVTAVTKNGKRFATTKAQKMWVKLNEKTPMFVRGQEDLKVGFEEIREGLLMTIMLPVKTKGASVSPRIAAFAVAG